ncbi:MAG TPA: AMP-binding protein, partial [Bradyrhizobium sp.]|nr:AMP-binding protein [Bradyrhizobium sp.]
MLTMSHAAGANEPAVRDITLGGLLQWAAETTPDRIALIAGVPDPDNRRQWTYAELYAQALRTARALRASFEPGERVAVWAHNIPEWIMVEFGAAMAGVILVTVNPGLRSGEVEYVLKQSRAAGVMVVPEFRGNPMLATVQALASRCPELREIIRFDRWDEFLASGDLANPELPIVRSTDAVMIQYTSGTAGFP